MTEASASRRAVRGSAAWPLVLVALLVACGGGSAGDAGPAAGSPAPSPSPAPPPVTPPVSPPPPVAAPAHYVLAWADEFDTPGQPDAARWVADTGRNQAGWYNNELQYYAAGRLENAEVRDGRLVITARRESLSTAPDWGGQRYTSARLITRGLAEWTYGFFEVRARMPCGRGTWPAIWTLGSGGRWPQDGELDILEHTGRNPDHVFSTVHTAAGSGGAGRGAGRTLATACSAFHDYQMHWTPERIVFSVDGVEHFRYLNSGPGGAAWPFDAPQFLILNIAIGGDLGGPVDDAIFPVEMQVEHVRVWQAPG
ncbi:MAG: glycoside hydrolase family 16 protein [Burkholderiaceae bacterium]|nr:glycoside hydrolase family 16 protein [Burkholderiaceae bacterium]